MDELWTGIGAGGGALTGGVVSFFILKTKMESVMERLSNIESKYIDKDTCRLKEAGTYAMIDNMKQDVAEIKNDIKFLIRNTQRRMDEK